MATSKSADEWFAAYAGRGEKRAQRLLDWICAPLILWSVLGFVWTIPVPPDWVERVPWFNWALVALALATAFYVQLSPALSAGLLFLLSLCYSSLVIADLYLSVPVWKIAAALFVLGWSGQFAGNIVARRRPSLRQDIVFILIGPAWLMSAVYRRLGQKY